MNTDTVNKPLPLFNFTKLHVFPSKPANQLGQLAINYYSNSKKVLMAETSSRGSYAVFDFQNVFQLFSMVSELAGSW